MGKTYLVNVKSLVTTYMIIEADSEKEAEIKARNDMPYEFSVNSFDSDLLEISEVSVSEIENN